MVNAPFSSLSERAQFVCGKVRKVRWAIGVDRTTAPDTFATGTWDQPVNDVSLWSTTASRSAAFDSSASPPPAGDTFVQLSRFEIGADCEDLVFATSKTLLVATSSGDVRVLDVTPDQIVQQHAWEQLHSLGSLPCAASCLSVHGTDVVTGGEDGKIIRLDFNRVDVKTKIGNIGLSSVRSLSHCGKDQVISGHLTGQLQVWDLRVKGDREGGDPCQTLAASTALDAVTSLGVHPAQPNLVAFGTQLGSVGFCDIRNAHRPLPDLLPIASGPIWEIAFHPLYPDNCFTCADDGTLLHWDAAALKQSSFRSQDASRMNVWLLGAALSDHVKLTNLLPDQKLPVNSVDLAGGSVLVGSDSELVHLVENVLLR
uniref:Nucleoporin Nup43 n=1 Tax=Plectus sambesii TaxID=2011161 RepID=A0A914XSU5_9BILA